MYVTDLLLFSNQRTKWTKWRRANTSTKWKILVKPPWYGNNTKLQCSLSHYLWSNNTSPQSLPALGCKMQRLSPHQLQLAWYLRSFRNLCWCFTISIHALGSAWNAMVRRTLPNITYSIASFTSTPLPLVWNISLFSSASIIISLEWKISNSCSTIPPINHFIGHIDSDWAFHWPYQPQINHQTHILFQWSCYQLGLWEAADGHSLSPKANIWHQHKVQGELYDSNSHSQKLVMISPLWSLYLSIINLQLLSHVNLHFMHAQSIMMSIITLFMRNSLVRS